jgi:hypothetical protein
VAVARPPDVVLAEARRAAVALADVVSNKKKPVVFNGEQYLEFEDWQTVGRFYGLTARVVDTKPLEMAGATGFEARAEALVIATGQVVSGAEAMCMNDEPNWAKKPLFQLRSMAQTRACAKALRNVLAWVVVLAGYKATPAEEMTGQERSGSQAGPAAAPAHDSYVAKLKEALNGDVEELAELTKFWSKRDNKEIPGCYDFAKLSETRARIALDTWQQKNHGKAEPQEPPMREPGQDDEQERPYTPDEMRAKLAAGRKRP